MMQAPSLAGLLLLAAGVFMGPGPAAAATPDDPAALSAASRAATTEHDYVEGLRLARRAEALAAPGSAMEATAQVALGEALFRAGRLDEAGIAFRRSLHLAPETAAAFAGLGRYLLTVPDYQAAGRAYRRAYQLDPQDPRVLRRLAGLVTTREEALRLYALYLELPPVEEEVVVDNVRAWVAMLETAANRKLYRLESEADAATVRLTRTRGVPWVDVVVAGQRARPFLLDSGASGVSLPDALFRRLNLEPVATFTVRGVSGATRETRFVLLPDLAVGPFILHDVPAVVLPPRSEAPAILGLSLLAPLAPSLVGGRRLVLDRGAGAPVDCPRDPWWRLRPVGGLLRMDVHLDGHLLHMIFDTGAARSVLSRAALKRLGLRESVGRGNTPLIGFTGAAGNVGRVKRRGTLSFLGRNVNVRGMAVLDLQSTSNTAGSEIDGIIGNDFLGDATYQVDYGTGRIRVQAP